MDENNFHHEINFVLKKDIFGIFRKNAICI